MSTAGAHRCPCTRPKPISRLARFGYRTWRMVPYSGIIQSTVIAIVALWLYIDLNPNEDVPYVPFVSCGPTQEPIGGVVGASHATGAAVRELNASPPTPREVQSWLMGIAEGAGEVVGTFSAAVKGATAPTETVDPTERFGNEPQYVAGGCTPCPTDEIQPVANGAEGPALAADAALEVGFVGDDAIMAVAVAGAESGYDPTATNTNTDSHRSTDRGMWQINDYWHAEKLADVDWRDPYQNAAVAYQIWEAGGWSPWVTYDTGAYRAHLGEAEDAVAAATGGAQNAGWGGAGCGFVPAASTDTYDLPGVKPWVKDAAEIVGTMFSIDTIHGVAERSGPSDHPDGLALDFMTADPTGTELAEYVKAHATELHVTYVIWEQHIWSVERADEGWRLMDDRGDPTANHMDHVHVSFSDSVTVTATYDGAGRAWPVPGTDTSTYHDVPRHDGVDINRGSGWDDFGDRIVAVSSGVIDYVGWGKGYGQAIFIRTDDGHLNVYGHTSSVAVRAGDRVSAGQFIGKVGNTGRSSAPHLHFAVDPGSTYEAAMEYLPEPTVGAV